MIPSLQAGFRRADEIYKSCKRAAGIFFEDHPPEWYEIAAGPDVDHLFMDFVIGSDLDTEASFNRHFLPVMLLELDHSARRDWRIPCELNLETVVLWNGRKSLSFRDMVTAAYDLTRRLRGVLLQRWPDPSLRLADVRLVFDVVYRGEKLEATFDFLKSSLSILGPYGPRFFDKIGPGDEDEFQIIDTPARFYAFRLPLLLHLLIASTSLVLKVERIGIDRLQVMRASGVTLQLRFMDGLQGDELYDLVETHVRVPPNAYLVLYDNTSRVISRDARPVLLPPPPRASRSRSRRR